MLAISASLCAGLGTYLLFFSKKTSPGNPHWIKKQFNRVNTLFKEVAQTAGIKISAQMFIALSLAAALIAGSIVLWITRLKVLGALSAVFAGCIPYLNIRNKQGKLQAQRGKAWPHLVDNLVSGVRAGMGLGETLLQAAVNSPHCLQTPFAHFAVDYRAEGNLDSSLALLKREIADPVADRIIEALRLAAQCGGNELVALLEDLGSMLRAEEQTRAEVLARQSWTITGAKLAAVSPWIILLLLLTRGQTYAVYSTPTGTIILLVGALLSVAAYLAMLRLGRLEPNPRTMRE